IAAGRMHAGEDLDQRRLAGAVLADQAEDFAAQDVERHLVERAHAGELLAEPAQLDHRSGDLPRSRERAAFEVVAPARRGALLAIADHRRLRRITIANTPTSSAAVPDEPGPPLHAHATPVRPSPPLDPSSSPGVPSWPGSSLPQSLPSLI